MTTMKDTLKPRYYVWADSIADMLMKWDKKEHVLHGMWTPSGYFHIGNSRGELFMPGLIHAALKDNGVKSTHNFFADDFDDFDKVPAGFSKDFSEHLGKPLREVPSPDGGRSWAEFFTKEVTSTLNDYGLKPNILSVYDEYKKGTYDAAVKIILDKAREVRDLWVMITKSERPIDWIPIVIKCEACGKTANTVAKFWDGKMLKYSCTKDRPYSKGCGHSGEVKPVKGRVKLPWRVNWAAGWFIFGTTFESAGKDHFTKGGSVETSQAFCKEIFGREPPLQLPTEFIQFGGKKISGSVGNVVSMKQWLEVAEPELLRFLMLSYQPGTVIDFDMQKKFLMLNDRYDESRRAYEGEKIISDKRTQQLKRQYELAQTEKLKKKKHVQLSYSDTAMIAAIHPNADVNKLVDFLKLRGIKRVSIGERKILEAKLNDAKIWLQKYAPDDMKLTLQEKTTIELKEPEKKAVAVLIQTLEKNMSEKDIQSQIYEIAKENNVEPKSFFKLLYQILLARESGPRLGPFIFAVGKNKIREILEKAIK